MPRPPLNDIVAKTTDADFPVEWVSAGVLWQRFPGVNRTLLDCWCQRGKVAYMVLGSIIYYAADHVSAKVCEDTLSRLGGGGSTFPDTRGSMTGTGNLK